jgi:small subunit ribosomal protein S8
VTDPVADMLTRIRNASRARHETTTMPASRLKAEIAKILQAEGFIAGYEAAANTLTVRLKYVQGRIPAITDVTRVSRPGLRVYAARRELPRVRRGLGVSIVSTSRGIMSGREAARQGLGGEVMCTVW